MNLPLTILTTLTLAALSARAELSVKVSAPTRAGDAALVKLSIKNTGTNSVQSARAAVFLTNADGKVVGRKVDWVIGGAKDKPGLPADSAATWNFVVPTDQPFTGAKILFTRIVLDNGQTLPAGHGYTIEK